MFAPVARFDRLCRKVTLLVETRMAGILPAHCNIMFSRIPLSYLLVVAAAAQASRVFLYPPLSLPSSLSSLQASAVISRHLGLESFEPLPNDEQIVSGVFSGPFVGQGSKNGLLLAINETDSKCKSI